MNFADTRASLVIEPAILPKAEWEKKQTEKGLAFLAQPGTWFDVGAFNRKLLALFCCPACHRQSALVRGVHQVDAFGKVSPDTVCTHSNPKCSFHRKMYLDRWSKKPLYCIVTRRGLEIEKRYCHATNQLEARAHLKLDSGVEIIGIAPAIGFYVQDKLGNKLTV